MPRPRSTHPQKTSVLALDVALTPSGEVRMAMPSTARSSPSPGLTCFGERKTIRQWANDRRCQRSEEEILARLHQGMEPWFAVFEGYEDPYERRTHHRVPGRVFITAWEETKSLAQWGRDPRCNVSVSVVRARLWRKWAPEDAVGQPPRRRLKARRGRAKPKGPVLLRAFGTLKSVSQWARDPRCKVKESCFRQRLRTGVPAQLAMTARHNTIRNAVKVRSLKAFGEKKSLPEWAEDRRCVVSHDLLFARVHGGWDVEEAIRTPPSGRKVKMMRGRRQLTVFGETKMLARWAEDGRCQCSYDTLISRLQHGWEPERAITSPKGSSADRRGRSNPKNSILVTAWGETKLLTEWSKDPRAGCSHACMQFRIWSGLPPELAIELPAHGLRRGPHPERSKLMTAFGETKTIVEWAEDPRSVVERKQLYHRIFMGWEPERALTTRSGDREHEVAKRSKLLTAFGETKTVHEWAKDPRCVVGKTLLGARLNTGFEPEEALTHPTDRNRNAPLIEAWGEKKTPSQWARDPRCQCAKGGVMARLARGWAPERAIGESPQKR